MFIKAGIFENGDRAIADEFCSVQRAGGCPLWDKSARSYNSFSTARVAVGGVINMNRAVIGGWFE